MADFSNPKCHFFFLFGDSNTKYIHTHTHMHAHAASTLLTHTRTRSRQPTAYVSGKSSLDSADFDTQVNTKVADIALESFVIGYRFFRPTPKYEMGFKSKIASCETIELDIDPIHTFPSTYRPCTCNLRDCEPRTVHIYYSSFSFPSVCQRMGRKSLLQSHG